MMTVAKLKQKLRYLAKPHSSVPLTTIDNGYKRVFPVCTAKLVILLDFNSANIAFLRAVYDIIYNFKLSLTRQ